ncbi:hypothetical protein TIFTF001_026983 [Ficus carica]|uniref:Uncharacterized protein n=1 Tax=Ficus carica TaxID=3494 RepID=A0AA88DM52_FICCA|nr:hypothetical protein TIFTF001_026983 [Ficus carica]
MRSMISTIHTRTSNLIILHCKVAPQNRSVKLLREALYTTVLWNRSVKLLRDGDYTAVVGNSGAARHFTRRLEPSCKVPRGALCTTVLWNRRVKSDFTNRRVISVV